MAGRLSVAEATIPWNVKLTELAVLATTVTFADPVASAEPLPSVLAKSCTVTVSFPTGALTEPLQGVVVQAQTAAGPDGLPPCGAIVTANDCVLGEI
jgi:hypothetical protein